jgi:cell division protein FtsX
VLLLLGKIFVLHAILGDGYRSSDVQALSFSLVALILLVVGLGVGALGSGMTLRRFLKV